MLTTAVGINKDKNTNIKYNNQLNKMMKMLQEVDPSFTILPWNPEPNEKRIHSEEDIPEYEEDLMRYVRNIRVIEHFNACQMTYKCSFEISVKELLDKGRIIYQNNKGWMKKEFINSENITNVGWICGPHDEYTNRNDLKNKINMAIPGVIRELNNQHELTMSEKKELNGADELEIHIKSKLIFEHKHSKGIFTKAWTIEGDGNKNNILTTILSKIIQINYQTYMQKVTSYH